MKPLQSVKQLGCPKGFSTDLQGWHSTAATFVNLIDEIEPSIIVEVGTWKGASAVHMASVMLGKIFCIDTWLGGIDHIQHEDTPPNGLLRHHGYPQLYYQFLHNVTKSGYADRIFPIPQTSVNGAKVLALYKIVPDLIYIDGSHEVNDVYADLCAYWPLLRSGGIMFGDDMGFPGVHLDTNRFAIERGLKMTCEENNFWIVRKP